MSEEQRYTISELAQAAAVTPRTIRFYTTEGLLPPPDSRGRYALYSADHLHRLQLIARLKAAYLPLNLIRDHITSLPASEVQRLLHALPADDEAVVAALPSRLISMMARPAISENQEPGYEAGPGAEEYAEPMPAYEDWQHVILAPGIELHLREPLSSNRRRQIEELIAAAQRLLWNKL